MIEQLRSLYENANKSHSVRAAAATGRTGIFVTLVYFAAARTASSRPQGGSRTLPEIQMSNGIK